MIFDAQRFGAVGDGRTLNTRAFEAAARACRDAGGGTLLEDCRRFEEHGKPAAD